MNNNIVDIITNDDINNINDDDINDNIHDLDINDNIHDSINNSINDDLSDDNGTPCFVDNVNTIVSKTIVDEADLYVTLDDIKHKAVENQEGSSETDSVTDSLIDRLWHDLELQNRKSVNTDNETTNVSRVSVAEYGN